MSKNVKTATSSPQKKGSTEQLRQIPRAAPGGHDREEIAEVLREWIVPVLVKAYLAEQGNRSVVEKS